MPHAKNAKADFICRASSRRPRSAWDPAAVRASRRADVVSYHRALPITLGSAAPVKVFICCDKHFTFDIGLLDRVHVALELSDLLSVRAAALDKERGRPEEDHGRGCGYRVICRVMSLSARRDGGAGVGLSDSGDYPQMPFLKLCPGHSVTYAFRSSGEPPRSARNNGDDL